MVNNKNLLVSVALIALFLLAWQKLVVSRYQPAPSAKPAAANATPAPLGTATPSAASAGSRPAPIKPAVPAPEAQPVKLENARTRVTLSTSGGGVVSWEVKEGDHWVELVPPKTEEAPLATENIAFAVDSHSETQVVLTGTAPSGYRVRKTLTLSEASPLHRLRLEFENPGPAPVAVNTEIGWSGGLSKHVIGGQPYEASVEAIPSEMRALGFTDHLKIWRQRALGSPVDRPETGPFEWAGVDNRHFLAALVPATGKIQTVRVRASRKAGPSVEVPLAYTLAPGASQTFAVDLYAGPKSGALLDRADHDLSKAVDFGFFSPISKALLYVLSLFHRLTGNWGWAIVFLTICLQLLVFPLTKKSLEHSVRLKELQPQIKKLQEQYKSDSRRLQIEMMNFYQKNGMRFMGMEGCFPMVLQIPIFWAFYSMLSMAYELRGAPWIGWIHNLAAADPHYVLPVLMGGGMFLQQKTTSTAMDPAQAKMMLIMPVMFTFFFLKLPSGLVLYWTVNSLMTILVQRFLAWRRHHAARAAI